MFGVERVQVPEGTPRERALIEHHDDHDPQNQAINPSRTVCKPLNPNATTKNTCVDTPKKRTPQKKEHQTLRGSPKGALAGPLGAPAPVTVARAPRADPWTSSFAERLYIFYILRSFYYFLTIQYLKAFLLENDPFHFKASLFDFFCFACQSL